MQDFDYCIETSQNRTLKLLLLTDIQIIDSANQRQHDRLTDTEKSSGLLIPRIKIATDI